MRKEVKLGMAIGGGVVGLLVVYLLVAPPGNAKKGVQLADASAGGNGNGSLAEPVAIPDSSASQSNQTPEQAPPAGHSELSTRTPEPAARRTEQATHGTVAPPAREERPIIRTTPVPEQTQSPNRGEPTPAPPAEARSTQSQPQQQPRAQMYFDPNAAWGGGVSGDAPALGITRQAPTPGPSPKAFVKEGGKVEGAAPGPNTHVVKSGETFSSIAQAAYGSAAYYPHLIRANPGVNPNNLKLGTVLNVPPVSEVKASGGGAAAEKAAAGPAGQLPAGPRLVEDVKIDPVRQYRVVSGDSLFKIGQKLYGKGTMGDRIYEANKQLIGTDPRRLKLGMILQLPEPPTAGASAKRSGDGTGQEVWNSVSVNPAEPYFGNEGERK